MIRDHNDTSLGVEIMSIGLDIFGGQTEGQRFLAAGQILLSEEL